MKKEQKTEATSIDVEPRHEVWEINKLIPYARNPRIHDESVPKLASLIKEFGFKVPIVIKSDGEIIDGHERYKAACLLGLKKVPVYIVDDWSDAQIKAFRIAVNKSAEFAKWDYKLLKLEFDELKEYNFDLNLTGFQDFEFKSFDLENTTFGELFENKDTKEKEHHKILCPFCGKEFEKI